MNTNSINLKKYLNVHKYKGYKTLSKCQEYSFLGQPFKFCLVLEPTVQLPYRPLANKFVTHWLEHSNLAMVTMGYEYYLSNISIMKFIT